VEGVNERDEHDEKPRGRGRKASDEDEAKKVEAHRAETVPGEVDPEAHHDEDGEPRNAITGEKTVPAAQDQEFRTLTDEQMADYTERVDAESDDSADEK
jgi:hypothetical protein